MGKTDWKAEAKSLKKKLKKRVAELSAQIVELGGEAVHAAEAAAEQAAAAVTKAGKQVSPLAPACFPQLPVIKGASFAAIGAGIKYQNRRDVMLVSLCPGTSMAGVFTRSSTRSACVRDCQEKLTVSVPKNAGAAIIVNSGNSNAFTGSRGEKSVAAVTGGVARTLGIPASRVFSSSTGVIGEPLPHDKITAVIGTLAGTLTEAAIQDAAEAIMTTDTFPKGASAVIEGEGGPIHIAGIAKGSGMIAPDMATMLVYIFTDAKMSAVNLQRLLSRNVDDTFNSITVDSDTSTSDTLLIAATGQSSAAEVKINGPVAKAFEAALRGVMMSLAHQVVRDGEGATKFVEIRVTGAATPEDALRVGKSIADSPLVKTAIAGEDPNWGRIVAAIGKSGAAAERDRLKISFGDILVAEKGWRAPSYTEDAGANYMKNPELVIGVDLGMGKAKRSIWTCDLTDRYIAINADYRS